MIVERDRDENGKRVTKFLGLPLGNYVAPVLGTACLGFLVWLTQLSFAVWSLPKFDPQRLERIAERLDVVTSTQRQVLEGTTIPQVQLRDRIIALTAEVAVQNTRCSDVTKTIYDLQRQIDRLDHSRDASAAGRRKP